MIKSYTSYAFIPPLKELRQLYRSLCVCIYIYSMHRLVPAWNQACISVRVMTVCVREMEVGDLPHYLCHQPDSPGARPRARCWGPDGQGPDQTAAWTDAWHIHEDWWQEIKPCHFCLSSSLTYKDTHIHVRAYKVKQRQTCYSSPWYVIVVLKCCQNVFNNIICYR